MKNDADETYKLAEKIAALKPYYQEDSDFLAKAVAAVCILIDSTCVKHKKPLDMQKVDELSELFKALLIVMLENQIKNPAFKTPI